MSKQGECIVHTVPKGMMVCTVCGKSARDIAMERHEMKGSCETLIKAREIAMKAKKKQDETMTKKKMKRKWEKWIENIADYIIDEQDKEFAKVPRIEEHIATHFGPELKELMDKYAAYPQMDRGGKVPTEFWRLEDELKDWIASSYNLLAIFERMHIGPVRKRKGWLARMLARLQAKYDEDRTKHTPPPTDY